MRQRARGDVGRERRPRRRCGRAPTTATAAWFQRRGRAALSPAGARDLILMNSQVDVRERAAERPVPDARPPPHRRPRLASRGGPVHRRADPGARFVELPGDDHVPCGRPGSDPRRGRGVPHRRPPGAGDRPRARDGPLHRPRRLDRAASRRSATRPGRRSSSAHDDAVRARARRASPARRSTPPATASSRSSTVRRARFAAALAIRDALAALGLDVRAGVHTGEVERPAGDKPRGIAVHVGARVMSLARRRRGARQRDDARPRRRLRARVRGPRRARAEGDRGPRARLRGALMRYARVVSATMSARLTSWIAARNGRDALVVRPISPPSRQSSCAVDEQLLDPLGLLAGGRSRSREALTASPSAPIASRWRSQSIGTAIEMYWWIRAKVSGWTSEVGPFGRESGSSSLARRRCAARSRRASAAAACRRSRRASRSGRRRAASSAGGRTDSRTRTRPARARPGGRGRGGRAPLQTDVSKKTPGIPPRRPARPAMSAIPACATMSWTPSLRRTSASRCSAIGGQPAAAVDEDRHRALDGELEDRLQALVVERERLGARVELDPLRAEIEAAARLLERAAR